jgi:predicted GNAT family acetyltransferase
MDHGQVHNNRELQRFELPVGEQVVFADYHRQPGRLVITHVEAPPNLRGKGVAGQLMQGMLDQARAADLKVLPLCPYARAWMLRRADYRDLMV